MKSHEEGWSDVQVRLVIESAVQGAVRGALQVESEISEASTMIRAIPASAPQASPVQIWDGDLTLVDASGATIGTLHAWGYSSPADHVLEIVDLSDPDAYFGDDIVRYKNLDTTTDPPWQVQQGLEAAYASAGSRRWGMAVTEHETGISDGSIEGKLVSPSLTGMTATWYRVEVGSGSTWDKAGMLYRVAEAGSPPGRCLDQWFFSSGYQEPNATGTREVRISKVAGSTTIATLHAEIAYTGSWIYQRFAWHLRPAS
jgi:hypothetical protein